MTAPQLQLDYATSSNPALAKPPRLLSIDAYRGAVMLLMVSELLHIPDAFAQNHDSPVRLFIAHQMDHVRWQGATLWDMIQPSFIFLVGVALPFSLAARQARGNSFTSMFLHALWRSLVLALLGILFASLSRNRPNWVFTSVLTQIALGYPFLFLLAWTRPRTQANAAAAILFFYWLAFALYPAPGPNFDFAAVDLNQNWFHLHGFPAHWDKSSNVAWAFDRWFLNLFPRTDVWTHSAGGYQTLNFIPSLATMIFGLLAGELLRTERSPREKLFILLASCGAALIIGWLFAITGICPMVKRIWTPSFALFSGGVCCAALAAFYAIIDIKRYRAWTFPLVIVGMNSLAMYCMAQMLEELLSRYAHAGQQPFRFLAYPWRDFFEGALEMLGLWLLCLLMYRRKLFLKI